MNCLRCYVAPETVSATSETQSEHAPQKTTPANTVLGRGTVMNAPTGQHTGRSRFPRNPESVSAAREYTRSTVESWGLTSEVIDVELVVSELVTNAIVHNKAAVGKEIELSLALSIGSIRVEVSDSGGIFTLPLKISAADRECGRGLAIVNQLTHRMGVTGKVVGKTVWAEIPHSSTGVSE